MSMLSLTSTTLLDGLRNPKNHVSWRCFSDRYVPMLLALAKRLGLQDADAQDVVGATLGDFTQAYRDGKYDRARGRLRDWLKGILRNNISRHFEKKAADGRKIENYGREQMAEASWVQEGATFVRRVDDATEQEWQLEILHRALAILRQESKIDTYNAFELYAIKQWPAKKVADFLKISANNVHQAKSRSLARLKAIAAELKREEEAAPPGVPQTEPQARVAGILPVSGDLESQVKTRGAVLPVKAP